MIARVATDIGIIGATSGLSPRTAQPWWQAGRRSRRQSGEYTAARSRVGFPKNPVPQGLRAETGPGDSLRAKAVEPFRGCRGRRFMMSFPARLRHRPGRWRSRSPDACRCPRPGSMVPCHCRPPRVEVIRIRPSRSRRARSAAPPSAHPADHDLRHRRPSSTRRQLSAEARNTGAADLAVTILRRIRSSGASGALALARRLRRREACTSLAPLPQRKPRRHSRVFDRGKPAWPFDSSGGKGFAAARSPASNREIDLGELT